jgi:cytochrome c oxidase subunit 4
MSSEHTAAAPGAHKEQKEHVLPIKVYLGVYGALVVLTYVTVQVSLLDLGKPAIYVAMAVAVVKAALVVGYFMHLKFDVRFNTFVFLSSVVFLLVFFVLTMVDLGSRGDVLEEQDTFAQRQEQALKARLEAAQKKAVKAPPKTP